VRSPALELMTNISHSDLDHPAVRYVLYGQNGVGKSVTLSHLIHYGRAAGFVVMPFAWIKKWLTKFYVLAESTHTEGRIDHVTNALVFMKNFRHANAELLADCVTHQEYTWSVREKTEKGAPLMEVVEVACERLPFAADAMNVVIKELKLNCNEGRMKLMVVVDGVNSLFADHTMIHRHKTEWVNGPYHKIRGFFDNVVQVDDCSVLRNIKKLLLNDYKNAVIVTSADKNARVIKTDPANTYWLTNEKNYKPDTASHLPFALLGEGGMETLSPFVPVEVEKYSEQELDTMIDYYLEKRYIQPVYGTHAGRQEVHFLTGRNPKDFFTFSNQF